MKKLFLLLSVSIVIFQGCGSASSLPNIDAGVYESLSDETTECGEVADLAVAFSKSLRGEANYVNVYNGVKCENKATLERAVRSAVLNSEETSRQYIKTLLDKAGKIHDINGNIVDLGKLSGKYIPVTYINDNYESIEEAQKDLTVIQKSFSDSDLDGAALKVLLIYNANEAYWNTVLDMMKSQQDVLSWELMWKAYNYDDDAKLEQDVIFFLKKQLNKPPTKGDIEYIKNQVYDLRVQFYYNSIEQAKSNQASSVAAVGIKGIYGYYDKAGAKRRFTITNRSGGDVYRLADIAPNSCNNVLHTGYVIDATPITQSSGVIPEIFLGVTRDPYYRYTNDFEGKDSIDNDTSINLSSGDGLGDFNHLYMSDKYVSKSTDSFRRYFQNDDQAVVSRHLSNGANTLFYNVNQVLKSRPCGPNVGFYVRLPSGGGKYQCQ